MSVFDVIGCERNYGVSGYPEVPLEYDFASSITECNYKKDFPKCHLDWKRKLLVFFCSSKPLYSIFLPSIFLLHLSHFSSFATSFFKAASRRSVEKNSIKPFEKLENLFSLVKFVDFPYFGYVVL